MGSTNPGDWLNYTANIAHPGIYTLHVRVATDVAGGVFHLAVDGRDVSGPISVPQTNGWQTWQTLDVPGIQLPGGIHTLQMVMDTGGYLQHHWQLQLVLAGLRAIDRRVHISKAPSPDGALL